VEKDVTHRREDFPRAPAENAGDFIFGRHPVLEALRGAKGPAVNKLWLQRGSSGAPVEEILRLAREAGVVFQWVDRGRLDQMAPSGKHQGVVARVSEFSYASLEDVLSKGTPSPLILLDGVEDPHNLGAVLRNAGDRSAVAVGRSQRRRGEGVGGSRGRRAGRPSRQRGADDPRIEGERILGVRRRRRRARVSGVRLSETHASCFRRGRIRVAPAGEGALR
jgi:hypothetical protein